MSVIVNGCIDYNQVDEVIDMTKYSIRHIGPTFDNEGEKTGGTTITIVARLNTRRAVDGWFESFSKIAGCSISELMQHYVVEKD